ncbi:MAG: 50S ribosomal protein L22 [Nanoarchaeota archaeon]
MAEKDLVKASGFNLPISTKHAIELCMFMKGKEVSKIKDTLHKVIEEKAVIKLKRFYHKRGHKKGHLGPGFYPKKASLHFLNLLKTLEGNARNKGLNSESLQIDKAITNQASLSWHYSRHRGRRQKRTNVEIYAFEKQKKPDSKKVPSASKESPKKSLGEASSKEGSKEVKK